MDNSTATGIANHSIKQKRSKAIDMRFYWIRDRVQQGQFHIFWKRGIHNQADYFTKHHPAAHHQDIRSSYLYEPTDHSKNYFECLQEQDSEMTTTPSCKITGNSPKSESNEIFRSG
jgi:predicted transposase YdaD